MSQDARSTAAAYFTAWRNKDFDTLRSILSDDATFRGPLGTADSGADCLAGLKGMAQMLTDIDVVKVFVDGPDVLTWFDLHTAKASPTPTANWMHIDNGKIARIRVTFAHVSSSRNREGVTPPLGSSCLRQSAQKGAVSCG